MQAAKEGVLILSDATHAPFASLGKLFDSVTPELAVRANTAYHGDGTRLVWKDAHGEGRQELCCAWYQQMRSSCDAMNAVDLA